LLKQLRRGCLGEALEVGCCTGNTRPRPGGAVRAGGRPELSPRMVEVARARSKEHPNVEYVVTDAAWREFPVERLDCAASIMTLHHVPLGTMLAKMRDARPFCANHS
jgi:hypothetical protein